MGLLGRLRGRPRLREAPRSGFALHVSATSETALVSDLSPTPTLFTSPRDRRRARRPADGARLPRAPARRENVFADTWLPLLEQGGVGLQVCPVYVDVTVQPEGSLREALSLVASFHRAVSENGDRVVQVAGRGGSRPRRVRRADRAAALARGRRVLRRRDLAGGRLPHARRPDGRPDLEPAERVRRRRRGGRRRALAARPRARRPPRRARHRARPRPRVLGRLRGAPRARRGRADPLLARRLPRRARHAAQPRRRPASGSRRCRRPLRPHAASARDRPGASGRSTG